MNDVAQAILTIIAAIIASVAGFLIVDRLVDADKREVGNDVAGFVYAVVGPMYAILLAFVVFVVWTHYEDANAGVATEANEVAGIWRQAPALSPSNGAALRALTVTYTQDVIHDEWPLLARSELSPKADKDFSDLYSAVLALPADTGKDQALFSQLLSETHNLGNERRVRLLKTQETLHPVLWIVLLAGGVLTIAYAYVFGLKSRAAHVLLVAVLAGTVVGMLCMIKLIDGPFVGSVSVRPDAFEAILKTMTGGG